MLLGPRVRGCVVALGKEREPWTPWPLFCTGQGAMLETLMNNILHQLAMTLDPLEGWKMSPESGARDGSAPGDLDPSPGPAPNGRGSLPLVLRFLMHRTEVMEGPSLLPGSE